jgi:transcriptional regulator with XRE-family HTH domain
MRTFHEKLKEYRDQLGMMQSVLAERVGLTKSHLNRIERGLRPPPQVETVVKMTEVLNLNRIEAEEFVELAGYSSMALDTGEGLVYNAPSMPLPAYDKLYFALSQLPPDVQDQCIEAFLMLIESLTMAERQVIISGTKGEAHE